MRLDTVREIARDYYRMVHVDGDSVMDHLEQSEARVPVKGARFGLGSTS